MHRQHVALVVAALVLLAAALNAVAQAPTPQVDGEAMTSTAIVDEATRRAAGIDAQGANGLSGIEQTATALAQSVFTPLPFDSVPDAPPQPGPNSNTGEQSPDLTPVLVVGAAFVVMIIAGVLARLGRGDPDTHADSDEFA